MCRPTTIGDGKLLARRIISPGRQTRHYGFGSTSIEHFFFPTSNPDALNGQGVLVPHLRPALDLEGHLRGWAVANHRYLLPVLPRTD
jgi:hypothetical protein